MDPLPPVSTSLGFFQQFFTYLDDNVACHLLTQPRGSPVAADREKKR